MVLLLLPLVDVWPLARFAEETTARTLVLSLAACLLGGALAFWLRERLSRAPLMAWPRWRPRLWFALFLVPALFIWGAPAGVQMIYSAALEGFVSVIAFFAFRNYQKPRRLSSARDEK